MKGLSKDSASWHMVESESAGQRLDNYLTRRLKGVPKSHIYRILRSGEVRVNSRRVGPDYRVQAGDRLRLPPVSGTRNPPLAPPGPSKPLNAAVLYEDDLLLVIDKPAGAAVHGGSGVSRGVIERLRLERPDARYLELAHRLDRETSGVLILAKRRPALLEIHRQLREGQVVKLYLALVKGVWRESKRSVKVPLRKHVLASGERRVSVTEDGLSAHTVFRLRRAWQEFSLLEAELKTGRTHQIRVHLAHIGFPIAGDDKYGDFALNRALSRRGLRRMFLHAARAVIRHPRSQALLTFDAPLPTELHAFIETLDGDGRTRATTQLQAARI